jgi:hypothetical protein
LSPGFYHRRTGHRNRRPVLQKIRDRQSRDRLVLVDLLRPSGTWGDQGETETADHVVVCRHTAVTFQSTTETAVHDDLFSFRPVERADRRHQRTTFAAAISRPAVVDMPGIEAEWAMVAMPSARNGRSDKRAAMAAFERFRAIGEARFAVQAIDDQIAFSPPLVVVGALWARMVNIVGVPEFVDIVEANTWQGNPLR